MLLTLNVLMIVAVMENGDPDIEENLHMIEETAHKVGLLTNVTKTQNMGVLF